MNADINSSAAIDYNKLNLTGSVVNTDVAAGAAIDYSKLNLTGSVVDADIVSITTAGKVANSATTATSADSVNTIVVRDASGDFAANDVTLSDLEFDEGGTTISKAARGPTVDNALAFPYVLISFTDDSFAATYGPTPVYKGTGGAFVDGKAAGPALGRAYNNQDTALLDWGTALNSTLNGLTEWSVCCWVNFNVVGIGNYINAFDGAHHFTMTFLGDKIRWISRNVEIVGGTTVTTGVWYWICVVQTSGSAFLYLNNVLDGTDNSVGTLLPGSALFSLFARSDGVWISDCILDDVSIYTEAISAAQRAAIFANGGNGDAAPSTVLAIARWNDAVGTRLSNSGVQIDNSGILYPGVDGVQDCGSATNRWNDIYATNATIQTSDINQKRDIIPLGNLIQDPKAFLMSLNPVIFKWKDFQYYDPIDKTEKTKTHTRNHFGLIAQEVEAVLDAQGIDKAQFAAWTRDEATGLQGLRYMEFVPILIKANQQLIATVGQMNLTITALEARITALENP